MNWLRPREVIVRSLGKRHRIKSANICRRAVQTLTFSSRSTMLSVGGDRNEPKHAFCD